MGELTLRFSGTVVVTDDGEGSAPNLETTIEVVETDLRDLINGDLLADDIPYAMSIADIEVTP